MARRTTRIPATDADLANAVVEATSLPGTSPASAEPQAEAPAAELPAEHNQLAADLDEELGGDAGEGPASQLNRFDETEEEDEEEGDDDDSADIRRINAIHEQLAPRVADALARAAENLARATGAMARADAALARARALQPPANMTDEQFQVVADSKALTAHFHANAKKEMDRCRRWHNTATSYGGEFRPVVNSDYGLPAVYAIGELNRMVQVSNLAAHAVTQAAYQCEKYAPDYQ